jgi:acid phosphatase
MKNFLPFLVTVCVAIILTSCHHSFDVPKYDHVIVVIEENHGYDEVIGSVNAPYISKLAHGGALFTDSHGVIHPSQPNYLAIFSGSTQSVTNDDCLDNVTPYTTPNLASSLISHHFTFKGYAQTMPSAGFEECTYQTSTLTDAHLYARKHAPWVNWQGDQENNIAAELSQPMTAFPKDLKQLPTISFVIPDMDHDMHNIGKPGDAAAIKRGDDWLKENLATYASWAKTHNSLLIITFDEDDFKTVNHIPTIFYGAGVKQGLYNEKISHYSVLHTLEAMYDLPVEDKNEETSITDIWNK